MNSKNNGFAWLTAQVPRQLAIEARKAAAALNISRSEYTRRALEAYLSRDREQQRCIQQS